MKTTKEVSVVLSGGQLITSKCMGGALNAVVISLKQLGILNMYKTSLRVFWSIKGFSRHVRVNASKIVEGDMATYGFTTMHAMLPFDTIVMNAMKASKVAQEYEAYKALPDQRPRRTKAVR